MALVDAAAEVVQVVLALAESSLSMTSCSGCSRQP